MSPIQVPQFPSIDRAVLVMMDISPADNGLLVSVVLPIKMQA